MKYILVCIFISNSILLASNSDLDQKNRIRKQIEIEMKKDKNIRKNKLFIKANITI